MTPRALRVGINLLFLGPGAGGVGRYARELPGALLAVAPETEITVFVANDLPGEVRAAPWADRVRWVTLPLAASSPPLMVGQYLALPALAAARQLDVLHSPANSGPVLAARVATVVTLHDLIWLHCADEWDPNRRAQHAALRSVRHSVRHADRIFAVSEAAADDLVASFGLARSRIVVTPEGVGELATTATPPAELRRRLGLGSSRVLLCVSQKRPYKNQETLIRSLPSLDDDVILVLPGSATPYEDVLRELASALGVDWRVRFPGWLSDGELAGLYALSDALAFPSLIEGFGLPVLEAMMHGLPVACSDIPALREVAGDGALLFDPHDQEAIDRSLRTLLSDRRRRRYLVARGHARARSFSWQRTAEATLGGYAEALASRR